jgi:LAGLIDADG DNA endonuclease family protein
VTGLGQISEADQRWIADGKHDVGRWAANGLGIFLHDKQLAVLDELEHGDHLYHFLWWANRVGKLQPRDEPVLTPSGWRPIGDLRVGDEVFAGDGSATTVVGVYPQGVRPVYRVTFDDGATTRAGGDHLWKVKDPESRFRRPRPERGDGYPRVAANYGEWSVMSTDEIRSRWGDRPVARARCAIPAPGPIQYQQRDVPLDPYALGLLLGDGGMSQGSVSFTSVDPSLVEALRSAGITVKPKGTRGMDWSATGGIVATLRGLGLMGHRSDTKFVPESYLLNTPSVRLAVLHGLLDTDGTVGKQGFVTYTSVSEKLADDVVALVRSLGGKARTTRRQTYYTYRGKRKAGQPAFTVFIRLRSLPLFRLERKLDRVKCLRPPRPERVLVSIEADGEADSVCIAVAHHDRTYITRDYIVTHNTIGVIIWHLHGIFYKPELAEPTTEHEQDLWLAEDYRTLHTAPLGTLATLAWENITEITKGTHPAQRDENGKRRDAPLAAHFSPGKERDAHGADHMVVRSLSGGAMDFRSTEGGAGRLEGRAWRRISWDEWPQQEAADKPTAIRKILLRLQNRASDFDAKILLTGTITDETEHIAKEWIDLCQDPGNQDWWGLGAARSDNPYASRKAIERAERQFDAEDFARSVMGLPGGVKGRLFPSFMVDPIFSDPTLARFTPPHAQDGGRFEPQVLKAPPRRSRWRDEEDEPAQVRAQWRPTGDSLWTYIHVWDLALAAAANVGFVIRAPADWRFGWFEENGVRRLVPLVGVRRVEVPGSRTLTSAEITHTIEETYLPYGGRIVLDTTDAHGKNIYRELRRAGYPVDDFTFNSRDQRNVLLKDAAIESTRKLLTEGMKPVVDEKGQVRHDADGVPVFDRDTPYGVLRLPKDWQKARDQLSILRPDDDKQTKDEAMVVLMACHTAYRARRARTRQATSQRLVVFGRRAS